MEFDEIKTTLFSAASKHKLPRRNNDGLRQWCIANKVAYSHVSEWLNGRRAPSPKMLEALGLEWVVAPKEREQG